MKLPSLLAKSRSALVIPGPEFPHKAGDRQCFLGENKIACKASGQRNRTRSQAAEMGEDCPLRIRRTRNPTRPRTQALLASLSSLPGHRREDWPIRVVGVA